MKVSRRDLLAGAAGAVALGKTAALQGGQPPADPTKVRGKPSRALGQRAPTEKPQRQPRGVTSSGTPHQDLYGTITPADLHFERHHGGVPEIDPKAYSLLIHGMVARPTVFTLADLKRFPAVSRVHFLECSGNFGGRGTTTELTPQQIAGLTSTSEWTGVALSTLFREVGASPKATWFLAEGQDAAVLTRSIPVSKAYEDALIAYGQNGEAIRPEHTNAQTEIDLGEGAHGDGHGQTIVPRKSYRLQISECQSRGRDSHWIQEAVSRRVPSSAACSR